MPKATRPQASTNSAVMISDRSTPGWDKDMATWVLLSSTRPRKKVPKLATKATTRLTAANTAALAA